ncbi:hypothetical protein SUDANB121_04204 [Nocardiopsis dassonvillei]|uniref:MerR family transcriptional regulator n=1 Tax=Nocardiopsis dassonvillei TaxID=2014 RepID=UPI003F550CEB
MGGITGMRIGDLAARTGVGARMLRYYEEQGLPAPCRTAAGQRMYGPGDVDVVHRIRRLLDAGLGTRVIRTVLECACGGEGDVEPCLDPLLVRELERMDGELARLARHRDAVAVLRSGTRGAASAGRPSPERGRPGGLRGRGRELRPGEGRRRPEAARRPRSGVRASGRGGTCGSGAGGTAFPGRARTSVRSGRLGGERRQP